MWTHVRRSLAQYYLSLRMSAALVTPDLAAREIPNPTPIIRQIPTQLYGGWDERELVGDDGDWIIVREATSEPQTMIWN